MAKTLVDCLVEAAEHPETGLRFLDRRERASWLGWSELYAGARRVAGGLRELGIERGERVALIYPTCPAFFDAFFGILLAGAVPVPLYPPVRLGRLDEYHQRTARMLRSASVRLVLAEKRLYRLLGETLAAAKPALGGKTLSDLPRRDAEPVRVSSDELGLVQFSSGTTVDPKPVALSHRAIIGQVDALNSFWSDSEEIRHTGVSWLPLYHDMGLIGCIFPALERPAVMTLIGPEVFVARPAVWLRAISTYRATISVAPNFAYGLCVDKIRDEELDGVDLGGWLAALNGAEAVAPSVLRRFQERFARWGFRREALSPVYGLSEAALAVTFSDLESEFRTERFDRRRMAEEHRAEPVADGLELASVGRPLPGFDLEIRDRVGWAVPDGHVGRVWVRGPSLMDGYLDRPEATARALRDGWLDTGDLGFLDRGELFLTGRAKDVVILRGRNHSPSEIEHALDGVAGVRTGCAVAASWLPEDAEAETFFLFVEHDREAGAETLEALPHAVTEAVLSSTGLRPDVVEILPPGTLPRTSSGKLRRGETLRRHLAGELEPPEKVTPLFLAGAFARSALAHRRARRAQKSEA